MAVLNVKEENRQWAISQLKKKCEDMGRLPKKADFDEVTRARIKAFLGPWPRALEAAGLKEPKDQSKKINANKKKLKTNKDEN